METFPTKESEQKPEKESISYEQILEAVKSLKHAGVKDPYDENNKEAQAARDLVDTWKNQRGLHMRGIGSMEKAEDIVRAANIWIEAGYTEPKFLSEALEKLNDEHADATREDNAGITEFLRAAADAVEQKLAAQESKEKTPSELLAEKLEEVQQFLNQGKTTDALGLLSMLIYLNPSFKRLPTEQREQIIKQRESLMSKR